MEDLRIRHDVPPVTNQGGALVSDARRALATVSKVAGLTRPTREFSSRVPGPVGLLKRTQRRQPQAVAPHEGAMAAQERCEWQMTLAAEPFAEPSQRVPATRWS